MATTKGIIEVTLDPKKLSELAAVVEDDTSPGTQANVGGGFGANLSASQYLSPGTLLGGHPESNVSDREHHFDTSDTKVASDSDRNSVTLRRSTSVLQMSPFHAIHSKKVVMSH